MAKANKNRAPAKAPQSNTFGKDIEVVVINKDSEYYEYSGLTTTDHADAAGNFSVDFGENGIKDVPANDLALPEDTAANMPGLDVVNAHNANPDEVFTPGGFRTLEAMGDEVIEMADGSTVTLPHRVGSIGNPLPAGFAEGGNKAYNITDAVLRDDYCNYGMRILIGPKAGEISGTRGKNIIDDDLRHAFGALNVHLAAIDRVFWAAGITDDIDTLHGEELALLYNVHGFRLMGDEGDLSVILMGSKDVAMGHRQKINTVAVPLEGSSSYKWYEQLLAAIEHCQAEIEAYKEGKWVVDENAAATSPNQLKIFADAGKPEGDTAAIIIAEKDEEGNIIVTGATPLFTPEEQAEFTDTDNQTEEVF